jgi:hypothetical protein
MMPGLKSHLAAIIAGLPLLFINKAKRRDELDGSADVRVDLDQFPVGGTNL